MRYPSIHGMMGCAMHLLHHLHVMVSSSSVYILQPETLHVPTACKIRYHHNYYHSSTVPQNIQIEEHSFVDAKLCEFFTHLSLFAWVSVQNSANIFNHILLDSSGQSYKNISSEQVSHAFVLNTLLWNSAENDALLILLGIGDNDE